MDPAQLIDRDRYPLDDPQSGGFHTLVRECRQAFSESGVALLPNLLTAATVEAIRAESHALVPQAYFCRSNHNVYLDDADPTETSTHPANRALRTNVGSIATDYLAVDSHLRALYAWPALIEFIAQVVGVDELYVSDDPLGAVSVNVFAPGDAHAWHFDESRFSVTLMVQPATVGGHFEYVRGLRDEGYGDTEQIGQLLDGNVGTERLIFEPGTLSIFAGRHTIHRVTEVGGTEPRLVPVLTYAESPGYRNSDAVRELFWGRVS